MGLSATLAATTEKTPTFSAKENAALYLEARACALADTRLRGIRVTKAAEQKHLKSLEAVVAQSPAMLAAFIERHDEYVACPSPEAQNVFMRHYVDKKVKPKVEAAVYFEAHARALAYARLNKNTNVRQFERRIEEVLLDEAGRNPDLLKAFVKKHDDYIACPVNKQGDFIKKYVTEKTAGLRSASINVDSVNIVYTDKNPSFGGGRD